MVRYLAEESAGQCGPCLFGLPALADALASLAFSGGRERSIDDVAALISLVERRGACRHPDGAAQLVRSLLTAFPADARWHQWEGACRACTVRRCCRCPATRKGTGVGDDSHAAGQPDRLRGHGMCAELLPEVIDLDPWGYPILVSPTIPRSLVNHAKRAAQACPTLALLIEDKSGKHR